MLTDVRIINHNGWTWNNFYFKSLENIRGSVNDAEVEYSCISHFSVHFANIILKYFAVFDDRLSLKH